MIAFIFFLVFLAIALLAIALRKTYSVLPPKELRRRAREGDALAKGLHRAVAYGASLNVLLWAIIVLAVAASFALLASIVPSWLAFIIEVIVIGYGFIWMPRQRVSEIGVKLAEWLTPAVVWLLRHGQPALDKIVQWLRRFQPVNFHTGLYDRDDLLALLEQQKQQPDSRLSKETLELLIHSLAFGEKLVSDCLTPRRVVKSVDASDIIGPIMMKELHDSGHSRFPVWQANEENIIGTLYLRELVKSKQSGKVSGLMDKSVYFVHEDHALEQVLDAFLKTKHHLFIVVNSFEEYVGIITIEDILEQIIGAKIVDEFDQYDDLRAVASSIAKKEHTEHKKSDQEPARENPPEPEETAQATSESKDEVK
jgi:CBS domain containing-hemolysin-like protein